MVIYVSREAGGFLGLCNRATGQLPEISSLGGHPCPDNPSVPGESALALARRFDPKLHVGARGKTETADTGRRCMRSRFFILLHLSESSQVHGGSCLLLLLCCVSPPSP